MISVAAPRHVNIHINVMPAKKSTGGSKALKSLKDQIDNMPSEAKLQHHKLFIPESQLTFYNFRGEQGMGMGMEGDLLSSSGQERSRSGLVQFTAQI